MFGGRHLTCIKFVDGGVRLWVLETNENSIMVFNLIEGGYFNRVEFGVLCGSFGMPHLVFEGI